MKVVINKCYGGFGLSILALKELAMLNAECLTKKKPISYYGGDNEKFAKRGEWKESWNRDFAKYIDLGDGYVGDKHGYTIFKDGMLFFFNDRIENKSRADKDLIAIVEKLGKAANGMCADLRVIEIPDGIDWYVSEYDGMESIEENHRSWS
jgi:hypothetical protein